jgi:hypothetical protein
MDMLRTIFGTLTRTPQFCGSCFNIHTGSITPQFHVVFDDLYSIIPNIHCPVIVEQFNADQWNSLVMSGTGVILKVSMMNVGNLLLLRLYMIIG